MKKLSTRLIVFALLISTSIFSYSYLTCVSHQDKLPVPLHSASPENSEVKEKETYFPNIDAINKIIEIGKQLTSFGA